MIPYESINDSQSNGGYDNGLVPLSLSAVDQGIDSKQKVELVAGLDEL